jgi:integrase
MQNQIELKKGEGSVIRLKQRDPQTGEKRDSKFWYILYYQDGRQVRENTKTDNWQTAYNMLIERRRDSTDGKQPISDVKKLRYEDLRDTYIDDLKLNGKTSLYTRQNDAGQVAYVFRGLDHFNKFFKNLSASLITTDRIREYIRWRQKEGDADPTIRRQLVHLRAMFRLAHKEQKLFTMPYFPMPKDSEAAGQYIDPAKFAELLKHLPTKLHPFFKFLYLTGCRIGAAKQITWPMVSQDASVIEVPAAIMKARQPLTIVLAGPGLESVASELRKMFRQNGDAVFYTANYRQEWQKACHEVGLGVRNPKTRTFEGLRIHDLRCSAAINLVDSGVSEDMVMKIGGWKTKAMFSRYNVANKDRLRAAMVKGGRHVERMERVAEQVGTR